MRIAFWYLALIVACSWSCSWFGPKKDKSDRRSPPAQQQEDSETSEDADPGADDEESNTGEDPIVKEFGLDARPDNKTCIAWPPRPEVNALSLSEFLSPLSFNQPVAMVQHPTTDNIWFVVERRGVIHKVTIDQNVASGTVYLDISGQVISTSGETGLLSIAFHPNYPASREMFLSYTLRPGGAWTSRFSRIPLQADDQPDFANESVLLEVSQPFANHNGGQIAFGPDGMLYIALGDGGSADDPLGHGQNTQTLHGSILRIDITGTDGATPYKIPPGNAFTTAADGLPEIYAWGLRNPWRFSFDLQSGAMWVADVGQNQFEEVNIVTPGGNYGWNIREAAHCFEASTCDNSGLIDPVLEYGHDEHGQSITGGYVYHGNLLPALKGQYLFADYTSGKIMQARYDVATQSYRPRVLLDSSHMISSFSQSRSGEMYVITYSADAKIYQISPLESDTVAVNRVPAKLSETGCVDANNPTKPADGLIPYDVVETFYTDNMTKQRYFAIPNHTTLNAADQTLNTDGAEHIVFPKGAVLMKSFQFSGKYIETRFLIHEGDDEWHGYVYKWNDDQSDATLVQGQELIEKENLKWMLPSHQQCLSCHTNAHGGTLGFKRHQLSRDFIYPGNIKADQIKTFNHIGLFQQALSRSDGIAPSSDVSIDINKRARSYLHVNCSSCHNSETTLRTNIDFSIQTSIQDANYCNVNAELGNFGVTDGMIVAPGSPESSILLKRFHSLDGYSMPAYIHFVKDEKGLELLTSWIAQLDNCD